jgi:hypothetical protein
MEVNSNTNLLKELDVNAFMSNKDDQTLATDSKPTTNQPQDQGTNTNTDNSTNP